MKYLILGILFPNEYLIAAGNSHLKGWDVFQNITRKIEKLELFNNTNKYKKISCDHPSVAKYV